jgi:DNA-binding NtrC family response regulator
MADILVVDDDQAVAKAFEHFLKFEGHTCRLASNAGDALKMIYQRRPDLVMMDVRMPGVDGVQALQQVRSAFPDMYVVIMTAYGTSQTSIDAIRAGAFDYLMKPLDLDELRAVIRKALDAQHLTISSTAPGPDTSFEPAVTLVGESAAMLEVYKMIGRLATNDVPALVIGEHGTGKRLVILTIHDNSARRDHAFTTIDCAEMPEATIDASLFGGDAGTVQLDRVEALPLALQSRLARAIGDERARQAERLSSRVLASTEHELADKVASGAFSRQLHDALSVITLRVPPLRERRDDIPLLVRHFIQRCNAQLSRTIRGVDEAAAKALYAHAWPGNVDELERAVKRACIVARGDILTNADIGDSMTASFGARGDGDPALERSVKAALHDRLVQSKETTSYHDIVELVESTLVREALAITNGNQVKAAELLGVNRATLRKKMGDE